MPGRRIPTVYDADGLDKQIETLALRLRGDHFFELTKFDPEPCQGDVLMLDAPVPVLDESGTPVEDDAARFWMVLSNTCDFARDNVLWSQIVPLEEAPRDAAAIAKHAAYKHSRRFLVPPWPGQERSFVADLLRPVTIDKRAIGTTAQIVGRMTEPAWILLHSCLVRFLARSDGRFD